MKRKSKVISITSILFILIIVFFFIFKPKQWLKFVNPVKYDIRTVDTKITPENILLDFEVLLSSNYFLNFVIDSLAYTIYFDSTEFSHGSKKVEKEFEKGQTDTFNLPLTIVRSALKGKMKTLEKGDSTNLRIKFENYIDLPLTGKTKFNVNINREIAAPQLPEIEVISVNKEELSLHDAIYSIDFSINNPNNYKIEIKEINADIEFIDLFSGKASSNEKITVNPKSKNTFTATIDIDNLELVRDGLRIAFRPNKLWPFSIDVAFIIEQNDRTPMNVNLSHNGEMELMGRRKNKNKED